MFSGNGHFFLISKFYILSNVIESSQPRNTSFFFKVHRDCLINGTSAHLLIPVKAEASTANNHKQKQNQNAIGAFPGSWHSSCWCLLPATKHESCWQSFFDCHFSRVTSKSCKAKTSSHPCFQHSHRQDHITSLAVHSVTYSSRVWSQFFTTFFILLSFFIHGCIKKPMVVKHFFFSSYKLSYSQNYCQNVHVHNLSGVVGLATQWR